MIKWSNSKFLWRTTLMLSLAGVLIGLLLRGHFVAPLPVNFRYFLHAHSHVMLLGWLMAGLLLLIYQRLPGGLKRWDFRLFVLLQFSVLGMLVSFPFQGYAAVSISFSTLHIFISYLLMGRLWSRAGILVRWGIVFHFLSTIGPFALGPMMALEMRGTPWYDQAIFFYLHFQYNGSLMMWLLALITDSWSRGRATGSRGWVGLFVAGICLTWAHSWYYSWPVVSINLVGFSGAILQVGAGVLLWRQLNWSSLRWPARTVMVALGLKLLFQVAGSWPEVADLVVRQRFLLIGWLHFIFLGLLSFYLWQELLRQESKSRALLAYGLGFLVAEFLLVGPALLGEAYSSSLQWAVFGAYAHIVYCWIWMLRKVWSRLPQ